jgi:hypothetical protein
MCFVGDEALMSFAGSSLKFVEGVEEGNVVAPLVNSFVKSR